MPTPSTATVRAILAALVLLQIPTTALAHPGEGIVEDRQGNIYYTDLENVWRVAPDGSRSIAVPGVHTHELFIDAEGNLVGEHLWYKGEATDQWAHYVWRRDAAGNVERLFESDGFRSDYSFIRDGTGTMYWAEGAKLFMRKPSGAVDSIAASGLSDVTSLAVTRDGRLFLIDAGRLFTMVPGAELRLLADRLADGESGLPRVAKRHEVLGLRPSAQGGVYAAAFGDRQVKHVDLDGNVTVVAETSLPWSPSGVMVARDGTIWLLEYSLTNHARVRRADETCSNAWTIGGAIGALLVSVGLIGRKWMRRRAAN